jgi:glycosyltransferase involved in cell wall biosynthesis
MSQHTHKMQVAYDLTPALLNPAGTGRYSRGLRTALCDQADVKIMDISHTSRRPRHAPARVLLGLSRELNYYPWRLELRARDLGADLIHIPAALGPLRARIPFVLTVFDVLPLRHPELFTRATNLHARQVLPRVARAAKRVITISEYSRREICELLAVPPDRVLTIHPGIDQRFVPRPVDEHWLTERFGVRPPYVLATGTLEPRKNLRSVLDAFSQLPNDVSLVVAGGHGWHAASIERSLERFGPRVTRTGFLSDDDLVLLYAGAACFVFPSLSEGFGLPPLEAMACGTPVVASNRTSLPEALGDAAILVDPEDVEALSDAVRRVLSDPVLADNLRERGRRQSERFTWSAAADATVAAYRAAFSST